MVSRQPKQRTLKDLLRDRTDHYEQLRILIEWQSRTDETIVLISGVYLEDVLVTAIANHFRDFTPEKRSDELAYIFSDEKDGPVSTFSAKARLAYALGIIGDRGRDEFKVLREIRNAFAHPSRPVNFNTPEISAACMKLIGPDDQIWNSETSIIGNDPKMRFLMIVLNYHWALRTYSREPRNPLLPWLTSNIP